MLIATNIIIAFIPSPLPVTLAGNPADNFYQSLGVIIISGKEAKI